MTKCLENLIKDAEAYSHHIQEILTDKGGEFDNKDLKEVLSTHGII